MHHGNKPILNGANVLIVYERKLTQELLASTLKQAGAGVILSCQPNEIANRHTEINPAYIFCEYSMSVLNGAQIIQQFRKILHVKAPAVMLVHRGDTDAIAQSKAVGVNVTLTVPFAVADVLAAIKAISAGGAAKKRELYFGE